MAALYEQGRVRHVRTFGKLEDQMCSFLPEEQAVRRWDETGEGQVSPDRLDTVVWGLSEVLVSGSGRVGGSV